MSTYMPQHLRQKALDRGIPDAEIPDLWEQHVERAKLDGIDAGGKRWDAFLEAVARELKDRVAIDRGESERAEKYLRARRLERQAKAAADRAYDAAAVNLGEWLAIVRAKRADLSGEPLGRAEAALAAAAPPGAKDDAGAWLLDTLRGMSPPQARASSCPVLGCFMPVESWLVEGRRYFGGRCPEHGRRAA
jgi:hypothetical protein